MSMSEDLYTLIQPLVGVTLIYADENAARPSMPYASIKMQSLRYVHSDDYSDPDENGIQTVKGDREFTLNLQYYGGDPVTALQSVVDKLRLTTTRDRFRAKSLVAFDTEAVADISETLENKQVEKRATVDIMMRYKSTIADNVGFIDTAHITGEAAGQSFIIVASV